MTQIAFSIAQAAQCLGIGKSKLYQLIKSNAIETIKIGTRRLVLIDSLYHLVANTRVIEGSG